MRKPVRQEIEEFGKDIGLVYEAVITGRKVGASQEFWAALAHDEELFCRVVGIVLPRPVGMTEAERMASDILGKGKVIGYRDSMNIWNIEIPEVEPAMPFTKEALEQCAEENKNGADWRVVYINGLSLRKQKEIRGTNRKKQPCFDPDYNWWLETAQDAWATQDVEAGYRLYDFKSRFGGMAWDVQSTEIAKLGESYERAEEQAVAEATFTIYLTSGKKERVLSDWCHWGRLFAASGYRVLVGRFDDDGFFVSHSWDGDHDDDLAVVLSRKFRALYS